MTAPATTTNMKSHSQHNLVDAEIPSPSDHTKSMTARVSVRLLATLMGGTLVLSSLVAEYVFETAAQAELMAMVGALLLGAPIVWHAFICLVKGQGHMDELVALAIMASFATKDYRVAGAVGFFMLLAELIETRTALGARATIESLIRITPIRAHLINPDGTESETEVRFLEAGQHIRVRPGDNIPADGEVIAGESTVNQATITGESMPVDKTIGDHTFAGTTNITGVLDVCVAAAGKDTTLGRVQSLILQAEQTRIPLMRIIDKYVHWYTPSILMIAAIVWGFTDMANAIAILVISCPCALILATPTAMVAALSCAARLGILIKDVQNLETAGKLTAMVFDKTGTMTTGQLAVTKLTPVGSDDGTEFLRLTASAEQFSKHPAARALLDVAKRARLDLSRPDNFEELAGRGVKATVDGSAMIIGRESWLLEQGVDMTPVAQQIPPEGVSVLYVGRDGKCIGWVQMEDRTRDDARQAIHDVSQLGVKKLVMVTGDRLAVAQRVAAEMGCSEVKAECLPHEKLNLVHQLQREGHLVAVIGDGVNDAPALAAGDLGIAMAAAGSDVAINSASVALMNNDLSRLAFLIRLSRITRRVVTQNLTFGVIFITVGIFLSGKGIIPTGVAAALHLVSSLVIVFNSARLVRFGEHLTNPGDAETQES